MTITAFSTILARKMNYPIKTIGLANKSYPDLLRHIPDKPKNLYLRGDAKILDTPGFGIVGTRKASLYGKDATIKIASDLSRAGFTIISGLAMGIDTIAHETALNNKGKTIAVLGSGIDDSSIFPRVNILLAKRILDNGGLIISEYPVGDPGYKSNFPERNRIISGLSLGVLVVEANDRSGSLITARHALEQNKDVFAIPGSIFSKGSIGPNRLIQKGAKLVSESSDIIEEYEGRIILNKSISTENPVEKNIIDILNNNDSASIDEIAQNINHPIEKILSSLSMLEINNSVINLGDGKYKIKK